MSEVRPTGPLRWVSEALGSLFRNEALDPKEEIFISVLFALLGSLARADGVVTAEEAAHGEDLIDRMELPKVGRKLAVHSFERGRAGGLDVEAEIKRFLAVYRSSSTHSEQLLEALLTLARADGRMRIPEKSWLTRVGKSLGVDAEVMKQRIGL
ncbi:MAG TPA: TerB family tellurite resistance protein [Xanthomonadales bacterium]|nr:TerB family tellurite resistance protein [Xanthomonadales bacterium]